MTHVTHSNLSTHLTYDPLTHCLICLLCLVVARQTNSATVEVVDDTQHSTSFMLLDPMHLPLCTFCQSSLVDHGISCMLITVLDFIQKTARSGMSESFGVMGTSSSSSLSLLKSCQNATYAQISHKSIAVNIQHAYR